MNIDNKKSLADLSGVDWGEPPKSENSLLVRRYELRRMPLRQWGLSDIQRFLEIDFKTDY